MNDEAGAGVKLKAQYLFEERHLSAAYKLALRAAPQNQRLIWRICGTLLILVSVVLFGHMILNNISTGSLSGVVVMFFMIGIFTLFSEQLTLWNVLAELKKSKSYKQEITMIFGEEVYEVSLDGSESKQNYATLERTVIGADMILLYLQSGIYNFVPRSAFSESDDFNCLAEILKQKTASRVIPSRAGLDLPLSPC